MKSLDLWNRKVFFAFIFDLFISKKQVMNRVSIAEKGRSSKAVVSKAQLKSQINDVQRKGRAVEQEITNTEKEVFIYFRL
jgi:hypothetical protein